MEQTEEPLKRVPSITKVWKADLKKISLKIRDFIVGDDIEPNYETAEKALEQIPLRFRPLIKNSFTQIKRQDTIVHNEKVFRIVGTGGFVTCILISVFSLLAFI